MSDARPAGKVASSAPAVTVLEELAHTGEPLGVSAPFRRPGLAKPTRMVRGAGDGRLLGHQIHELGRRFRTGTGIAARFRPSAADLPVAPAETLMLAVPDGTCVVYPGRRPVRPARTSGRGCPDRPRREELDATRAHGHGVDDGENLPRGRRGTRTDGACRRQRATAVIACGWRHR